MPINFISSLHMLNFDNSDILCYSDNLLAINVYSLIYFEERIHHRYTKLFASLHADIILNRLLEPHRVVIHGQWFVFVPCNLWHLNLNFPAVWRSPNLNQNITVINRSKLSPIRYFKCSTQRSVEKNMIFFLYCSPIKVILTKIICDYRLRLNSKVDRVTYI